MMKCKLSVVAMLFLSIFLLCSFDAPDNDNKDLQNSFSYSKMNESDIGKVLNDEAESYEDYEDELSQIYERFLSIIPSDSIVDPERIFEPQGISEVFEFIINLFIESGEEIVKNVLRFLAVAIMFSLAEMFFSDTKDCAVARAAVGICLSVPIMLSAEDIISCVKTSLESGSSFFSSLIPIVCAVCSASGGVATASAAGAGMTLSLGFVLEILSKNLFVVSVLIFSVSLISSADTEGITFSVSRSIRNWFNFGIGITSLVIVAVFSLQTLISSSSDSFALRGARYAAANMIPIVGNVIAGALSTLASGVRMLSSFVGVASVLVILSFMGAPIVSLLAYRFCVGVCVTFCSFSSSVFAQRFFESIRGAIDCLIGVMASSTLIYVLEIIIFMKTAAGGI